LHYFYIAEEVFDDLIEIGDVDDDEEEEEEEIFEEEDVDDEEFDIQMEGDEEYYDEEEGYVEEEEEDESSVSTDIWASYDAINEDAPVPRRRKMKALSLPIFGHPTTPSMKMHPFP